MPTLLHTRELAAIDFREFAFIVVILGATKLTSCVLYISLIWVQI